MASQSALARKYIKGLTKANDIDGHIPTVLFTLARSDGTSSIYVRSRAAALYDLLVALRDGPHTDSSDLSTRLIETRLLKLLVGAGYITHDHRLTPHGEGLIQEHKPMSTLKPVDKPADFPPSIDPEPTPSDPPAPQPDEPVTQPDTAEVTPAQEPEPAPDAADDDLDTPEELPLPPEYEFVPSVNRAVDALEKLRVDPAVKVRGLESEIEIVRTSLIHIIERCGLLQEQVDLQRNIIKWWNREATTQRATIERMNDFTNSVLITLVGSIEKLAEDRAVQTAAPLTRANLEIISDLAYRHTGHRLHHLLSHLNFDLDDEIFRSHYPTFDEAHAIIAKRIIDEHVPVMAYAARSKRARNQSYYLELHWGFGVVNAFDAQIKALFADYPHDMPYTDPDYDADLNPPVELILERDARNYPRIKSLRIVS